MNVPLATPIHRGSSWAEPRSTSAHSLSQTKEACICLAPFQPGRTLVSSLAFVQPASPQHLQKELLAELPQPPHTQRRGPICRRQSMNGTPSPALAVVTGGRLPEPVPPGCAWSACLGPTQLLHSLSPPPPPRFHHRSNCEVRKKGQEPARNGRIKDPVGRPS